DEDGKYTAEVPIIPGCISAGATREEALANIKDAIGLCLESQEEEGWALPPQYSVEHVEVVTAR
ncbi:MAG: type II toxin-antitoxin system HicB family antitoxin, partial [Dehalococcoidia bacterium]